MMPSKRLDYFVAGCLVFFLGLAAGACASSKPAPDKTVAAAPPPQAGESQRNQARLMEAGVEEKNLRLKDRTEAIDYLRAKLVGLLAEKLTALGFSPPGATKMASTGRLVDFEVSGHREKFAGKGAEEGRIIEAEVWDVRGKLEYLLGEQDVASLCQIVGELPADSVEAAEKLASLLDGLEKLEAPAERLSALKERLAGGWAQALGAVLQVLRDAKVTAAEQPPADLVLGTERLGRFIYRFSDQAKAGELSRTLGQAWLRWLFAAGPEAKLTDARRLLKLFREKTGGLSEVSQYVEKAVELAWRDRLEKLDAPGTPFSVTREEFLVFLEEFPSSHFFAELELRFAARWVEHLLSVKVPDTAALEALEREVRLLGSRFPTLSRREDVSARAGSECLRLLTIQKPADLAAMAEVRRVLGLCNPYLPAGLEASQLRVKLDETEQELSRQRDDALEQQALKGLDFFIAWEKAIRQLKWGSPLAGWQGQGEFQRLWSQGRDAGADCHCSLDPEEPCRLFDEQSPRGGFEVVARFHQGKLAGVDLCNVFVGERLTAVYGFFSRRYPRRHRPAQATRFLGTGEGEVSFGKAKGLLWWLSCGGGTCVVRARDERLHQEMLKQQQDEKSELRASVEAQRRQRIGKGWSAGDCVRWECAGECAFEGRVERRDGSRYQVTVERSADDPRLAGSRRWVEEQELYDCR